MPPIVGVIIDCASCDNCLLRADSHAQAPEDTDKIKHYWALHCVGPFEKY